MDKHTDTFEQVRPPFPETRLTLLQPAAPEKGVNQNSRVFVKLVRWRYISEFKNNYFAEM